MLLIEVCSVFSDIIIYSGLTSSQSALSACVCACICSPVSEKQGKSCQKLPCMKVKHYCVFCVYISASLPTYVRKTATNKVTSLNCFFIPNPKMYNVK